MSLECLWLCPQCSATCPLFCVRWIQFQVCHPPSYWLRLFPSQTFSCINTPTFLKPSSFFTPTCLWICNRQSVPKRRDIKFRRRGITRKKAYNIQDTAKVWNQKCEIIFTNSSINCENYRILTNYLTSSGFHIEIGLWYFHMLANCIGVGI